MKYLWISECIANGGMVSVKRTPFDKPTFIAWMTWNGQRPVFGDESDTVIQSLDSLEKKFKAYGKQLRASIKKEGV